MSKTFRDWEPDQVWRLPPSLAGLVPSGHLAHFVGDTVRRGLDLGAILGSYGEERGYPPYHPGMMVALLLYAYSQGVYASRRIARGCEERLDFAAVTAMQRPDFRTISDFRKRHSEALRGLFVQVLRLCREAGLVKLGHVALDGTKIKANASKHKAMSYARMVEAEPKLAAEVAGWLKTAGQVDRVEDRKHGAERRGDETPDWVANKQRRLAKIREAKAALEAEAQAAAADKPGGGGKDPPGAPPGKAPGKAQRNFIDPQSRIMKTKDGFIQGFNAQAAVDATAQIMVAEALSNQGSDCPQLVGLVEQITTNLAAAPEQVSADAGYSRRTIWRPWKAIRSTLTSPPADRSTVHRHRKRGPPRRKVASQRWRQNCAPLGTKVPTDCASRWSNRCSGRSNRRAASVNSCGAASPRCRANGR